MPRAPKYVCAYAEASKPAPKPRKPRVTLTDEEKAAKKEAAAARKELKEKKKAWEDSLKQWRGECEVRGTMPPEDTECMYKSDAKKYYKLSDKDLAALPFYQFAGSSRQIFPLAPIIAHVKRRFEAAGIEYPKLKPDQVVLSARYRKNLRWKSTFLDNLNIMKNDPVLAANPDAAMALARTGSSRRDGFW